MVITWGWLGVADFVNLEKRVAFLLPENLCSTTPASLKLSDHPGEEMWLCFGATPGDMSCDVAILDDRT